MLFGGIFTNYSGFLAPYSGELYPCETDERLCDVLTTGNEVEVDMEKDVLTDLATGKKYNLKPLGDVSFIGNFWGWEW